MDYVSLGAHIRRERVLRGWTQEHLAEKASISLSFLGHIERGTRKASLETLVTLANVLEVSMDRLLSDSLKAKSHMKDGKISSKKQTALKEILRTVEEALTTWSDEK